ncbi:UNVERIFIED_CONTAM: hypothetical protein Slati_4286700 [Sesamum latifolium]|uniref:Ty3-gypsy retrotransposon protein n=1 Tax=Sesamum latifolium TaxID=2727402 RepID=A0AAW2TCN8_9LAMI
MDTQGKATKSVNSKLAITKSSSSSTKSAGVTTRSISRKLKESSQMTPLIEYVQRDLGSPDHPSEDEGNKSPMSSPCSVSSYSFTTMWLQGSTKEHYAEKNKSAKEFQISFDGLIPVDQLKEFIEGTIRRKIEGSSKSSLTYSKPYTQRIDSMKMPMGYQPPKFQQFDGKGNPKQHVVHFIETCNNAGTYGDYLVKQFVRIAEK